MSQLLLPVDDPEQLHLWTPCLDLLGHFFDLDTEQVGHELEDAAHDVGEGEVVTEFLIDDSAITK